MTRKNLLAELLTKPLDDIDFAIVDTETTGMNSMHSRIMDIGIVKMRGSEIMEKWETLINPQQEISYWITFYTNLRDSDVNDKPVFNDFAEKIADMLKNTVFVAHNVGFDYSFLNYEMKRAKQQFDHPKLCTVMLGRKLLPQLANAHLDALSDYYNIKITNRHRALPDAEATAVVFQNFIEIAQKKYGAKTFFDLEKLQKIKVDSALARGEYNGALLSGFEY